MKSLCIAFAMYSKLPVPHVDWDKKSLSWALCWFPLIGGVIGGGLLLWFWLSATLHFGPLFRGIGALIIPIALSGAIHLDGFCDTADALGSHQTRERKLEILQDSHTGAFAIICCTLYLLLFFAAWSEVVPAGRTIFVLALGPVLSRSLSGLMAVTQKNARGSGLLATFTQPMEGKKAAVILALWAAVTAGGMLLADPLTGVASLLAAGLTLLYYGVMSRRQFGGITGDLAGFFLQICECAMVLAVVLAQHIEVLL
ncbi:MAG: adenosylcobinamide-GDP ribazoletransferase [Oscillospiraceae bacterium]